MAATLGTFDPELRNEAEFDPQMVNAGIFDKELVDTAVTSSDTSEWRGCYPQQKPQLVRNISY